MTDESGQVTTSAQDLGQQAELNLEQIEDENFGDASPSDWFDVALWSKRIKALFEGKVLDFAKIITLTTVAGYFVIHSYFASITNIRTYNINPIQYIGAGISLSLCLPVWVGLYILYIKLIDKIISLVGDRILKSSIVSEENGGCLKLFSLKNNEFIRKNLQSILYFMEATIKIVQIASYMLFLFFVITISSGYGKILYRVIPMEFGGGKPTEVTLIFNEGELQNFIGIITAITSNQTAPVELIMELTDGYLIRDKTTGVTLIIKNELVQAIVDPSTLPAATPSPTASPTIDPSITLTPNTIATP